MPDRFELVSPYQPTGDQPEAIDRIVKGLERGEREIALMGVTGSGKTFTMANVIARLNRPTLILAHNKTLAAKLFPQQRGGIFCELLRLLSAGGVHCQHRHLY